MMRNRGGFSLIELVIIFLRKLNHAGSKIITVKHIEPLQHFFAASPINIMQFIRSILCWETGHTIYTTPTEWACIC